MSEKQNLIVNCIVTVMMRICIVYANNWSNKLFTVQIYFLFCHISHVWALSSVQFILEGQCFQKQITLRCYVWSGDFDNEESVVTHR